MVAILPVSTESQVPGGNGNGQTDERIELGATQSDDRCLAMNGDGQGESAAALPNAEPCSVVSPID